VLKAILTDIDGTITDSSRRINTDVFDTIRFLVDEEIELELYSHLMLSRYGIWQYGAC